MTVAAKAVGVLSLAGWVGCAPATPATPAPSPQPTIELTPARAEADPEPAPAANPAEPAADPEQLLADDHAQRFPRRAQLRIFERARIRVDGPELVREEPRKPHPDESVHVVADQSRDYVRIITEGYHLRLLVWVSRDQLVTVVRDRAIVRPERRATTGDGVTVYPGLPLTTLESTAEARRVSYQSSKVRFSGWMPLRTLDQVYVPMAMPERPTEAVVDSGATVRTSSGAAIAAFLTEVDVARLGAPSGGKQRILHAGVAEDHKNAEAGWFDIQGLVEEAKVSSGAAGLGISSGHGEGWGGSNTIRVPMGTRFHDAPDGQLVGVTTLEVRARERGVEAGWRKLELMTRWGFARLFARDDAAP